MPAFEAHFALDDALSRSTSFVTVPAFTRVADELRERIIAGYLTSGTRLHEVAVAKEFSVSRNTVREALRELRAEGLVAYARNKGVVVRFVEPDEVIDLYKMRRAVEVRAIQESGVASARSWGSLNRCILEAEEAMADHRWRDVGTASLRFHQQLVALLDCRMLDAFFRSAMAQMRLIFALMEDEQSFQAPWVSRDGVIYEQIVAGARDQAISELTLYLQDSERATIDVVRQLGHRLRYLPQGNARGVSLGPDNRNRQRGSNAES